MLVRSVECSLVRLMHVDNSLFGDANGLCGGRSIECSSVHLVHRDMPSVSDGWCGVDLLTVALFSWYIETYLLSVTVCVGVDLLTVALFIWYIETMLPSVTVYVG